ncbi:phosphate/phosphite/phosphonate ABC transporter substrate-binding protein [uncultured Subdoligranulum sp.]|mgnify:CR=1 FL=1|uniref:phosphate/phosphite/phosphonate ABC transporter substrate-binding protein n=1 Tax=uncultured Subdoligranulum sp. TaxID=512298 RepID=UPI002610EF73|nr:phosphate/phosphite/phosphonate ABC transporter substrate-binding protein [uncultured Subdoligranulum sp.]
MNCKTKLLALTLASVMTASLAGCGASASAGSATSAEAASATQESAPGGEDGVFTIAYAPNESNTEAADARNGLADDLSAVLGCEVEEIQASDYNAIIEALRTGKADMAYMGSQALALGVERTNLEPIVMKAEDGDPEKAIYHSVLITSSANEDINSIEDIKGKTMAFVDPDSTSGNLVPTAEIIQAFPDEDLNSDKLHTNGDFFEAVSFSGSHQAGLQAVIKGDVDVVPISDQILASEIANGNAAEGDVKIIHESAAIPAEAVVVAEQVDQATRDKLVEFLTSYDNEQYFTDVIKVPGARFVECDMSDYEDIIELNKIINEF